MTDDVVDSTLNKGTKVLVTVYLEQRLVEENFADEQISIEELLKKAILREEEHLWLRIMILTGRIRSMNRADAANVPLIAVSANAFAQDVQESYNAGINEHLAKPIDIRKLYRVMTHYLNDNA